MLVPGGLDYGVMLVGFEGDDIDDIMFLGV